MSVFLIMSNQNSEFQRGLEHNGPTHINGPYDKKVVLNLRFEFKEIKPRKLVANKRLIRTKSDCTDLDYHD